MSSTIQVAEKGLPIAYATASEEIRRAFAKLVEVSTREIGARNGYSDEQLKVAAHSWGWIEENSFQAIENYFYPTKQTVDNIAEDCRLV